MKIEKPILRGHFHQAMFFISLGACSILIHKAERGPKLLGAIIYSISIFSLFGISSLYHRINWQEKGRILMKRLDHSAIYIMIAGTCTPICLISIQEPASTTLLLTMWIVATVGIIQSVFFVNLPKYISSILYLIAGYTVMPYLPELSKGLGTTNVALILVGGFFYTSGAIFYGLKWPKLNPKYFGYHELFHIFVNIAALLHFLVIYSII